MPELIETESPEEQPKRTAGILLHPTSLPGPFGIGDLGDELIEFLDWAAKAGIGLWQVLPLNPPGYGNSPYGCLSSFAGNPSLISPKRLVDDGLLPETALAGTPQFPTGHADFEAASRWKAALLRQAWRDLGQHSVRAAFATFCAAPEQESWLEDFALYMALHTRAGGAPWWSWDRLLVRRDAAAMKRARTKFADDIEFEKFVQFLFYRQWDLVRQAARSRGIQVMGDVPIYVAGDSADVWSNQSLFQLDEQGHPTVVAGVPPDYFSKTGQRWGNPLYRWDVLHQSNYAWWIERVRANLRLADIVRLDHFRGFSAYWEVPASEETAVNGHWVPGPGKALFDAMRNALGSLPLVAEDLGLITRDVHQLRHDAGLPGMKILQFGFSSIDSPHLPHRYDRETVVYTGTHDNDTARGWFDAASGAEQDVATTYLGCPTGGVHVSWALIRAALTSVGETAIIPLQDILALGSEARMNRPGAEKDNWGWRYEQGSLTPEIGARLRRLVELSGRLQSHSVS